MGRIHHPHWQVGQRTATPGRCNQGRYPTHIDLPEREQQKKREQCCKHVSEELNIVIHAEHKVQHIEEALYTRVDYNPSSQKKIRSSDYIPLAGSFLLGKHNDLAQRQPRGKLHFHRLPHVPAPLQAPVCKTPTLVRAQTV
jgi:hypothetical protein